MVRAVLFDFFGTLVEYEPDRTQLLYPTTVELLAGWGFETTHEEFVQLWDRGSRDLEDRTASSHAEFSMRDAVDAFCATSGGRTRPRTVRQPRGRVRA